MNHTAQWQSPPNSGYSMPVPPFHTTSTTTSTNMLGTSYLPPTPISSQGSPPWASSATSQPMTNQRTNFDFQPPSGSTHINGHTRTETSTAKRQSPFTSGPADLWQELKSVRKELRRVSSERDRLRSQTKDLEARLKSFKLNAQGKQGILVEKNRKLTETCRV